MCVQVDDTELGSMTYNRIGWHGVYFSEEAESEELTCY